MLIRPPAAEVPEFFRGYVKAVPEEPELLAVLAGQLERLPALLAEFSEARSLQGYAAGKWTLRQSVEHISDTERVMSFRLLRIARGDRTPLPGFDQDLWVAHSRANERPWPEIVEEWKAVRRATLALVHSLDGAAWARTGTSSGVEGVSVRAFGYVLAGHVEHHLRLIEKHYRLVP
ncbi:MAG: DinB family protein [Acidobacteria bacterium]|nr:DinB family protein [Acidobacteriota bacterium]